MNKPKPEYEIYTKVIDSGRDQQHLYITVESQDMANRLESEALDYGKIGCRQGLNSEMRNTSAGNIPVLVDVSFYHIEVRPTFNCLEVAKWLGRDGLVEIFCPSDDEQQFHYPTTEDFNKEIEQ
jgi:hypothetical protein